MANVEATMVESKLISAQQTSYVSDSYTPSANVLLLCSVGSLNVVDSTAPIPTVAGNNLTWVQIATKPYSTNNRHRVTLFRAMGSSPATGVTTITVSENQWRCGIIITEFANVQTSGLHGADAIVQFAVANGTVNLSAFGDAKNATFGTFSWSSSGGSSPGTGFTELFDFGTGQGSQTDEWRNDNDTTVTMSNSGDVGSIAVEIAFLAAASARAAGTAGHLGFTF